MQITIHRGTDTIGGNCIEINSGGKRILFDIGSPLMEKGGGEIDPAKMQKMSIDNGVLPDVKGLYKDDIPDIEAIFISHAHMDHYGLLDFIHQDIPVYLSKGSRTLIEIGKVFFPEKNKIFFDNFTIFDYWKPINLGPLKITSYLMDHSGFDASSFLIEANGKRVFYSGDFRGHGRKAKLLDNFVKWRSVTNVDCLLLEGTTLGGQHKVGFTSEAEVEQGFADVFRQQKDVSFVVAAGSNVDRLVSLYNATKKTGKSLVLDYYSYYILYRLKEISGPESRLPPIENDHIRIFPIDTHRKAIAQHLGKALLNKLQSREIALNEIVEKRKKLVLKLPFSRMKSEIGPALLKNFPLSDAHFIFSMWKGYLQKDQSYEKFCLKYGLQVEHIHVSGHAYLDDLQRLARAINPKQLVPIHTLSGGDFSNYFDNVVRVDDGEPFVL